MEWQQWVLVAWLAFSALTLVFSIGRERKPLTPGAAVISLLILGALTALVVTS